MKERPILFKGEMVRAILEGRKTQTRRMVKPQPELSNKVGFTWKGYAYGIGRDGRETQRNFARRECPCGKPGDRLWVREAWSGEHWLSDVKPSERISVAHPRELKPFPPKTWYWADGEPEHGDWEKPRPSIHMPRWASRITLEITDVRVERLQDISEEDAECEGVTTATPQEQTGALHKPAFRHLWGDINGPESWSANPWVWVVEFKRIDQ